MMSFAVNMFAENKEVNENDEVQGSYQKLNDSKMQDIGI